MNNFLKLLAGEFQRLVKYRIVVFGVFVSAIWVLIIALTERAEAQMLFPMLVAMDTGMMSIVLLGASFFFEKQEGSIKTLLVAPVGVWQIIAAKVIASIVTGLLSSVMIMLAGWLIHGLTVSVPLMLAYTILAVFGNTALGYIIILWSRDFMGFLMKYMIMVIVSVVPLFLVPLGLLPSDWIYLGIVSPMFATNVLIESLFGQIETGVIVASAFWLLTLGAVLYPAVIYRRFRATAIEG